LFESGVLTQPHSLVHSHDSAIANYRVGASGAKSFGEKYLAASFEPRGPAKAPATSSASSSMVATTTARGTTVRSFITRLPFIRCPPTWPSCGRFLLLDLARKYSSLVDGVESLPRSHGVPDKVHLGHPTLERIPLLACCLIPGAKDYGAVHG